MLLTRKSEGKAQAVNPLARAATALAAKTVDRRTFLKGTGLGYCLMRKVIDYARLRGVRRVHGDVLAENATMLLMARELGFEIVSREGDVVMIDLDLAPRRDEDA